MIGSTLIHDMCSTSSSSSRWRHNWRLADVVNSHLMCYVRPHNQATRFRPPLATVVSDELFSHGTGTPWCPQKEMATYLLCPCGETQTMSHTVESCPLTKLNGGLSRLQSAYEDTVSWLTSYGSRHAYEKKKKNIKLKHIKSCFMCK